MAWIVFRLTDTGRNDLLVSQTTHNRFSAQQIRLKPITVLHMCKQVQFGICQFQRAILGFAGDEYLGTEDSNFERTRQCQ